MKYKISGRHHATVHFEIGVDIEGIHCLVIFGSHVNGHYCCIPNWNFSCEMGEPNDVDYNADKLMQKFNTDQATALATAIKNEAGRAE